MGDNRHPCIVKHCCTRLCLCLLVGCSESSRTVSTTHTGDLGAFILRMVEQHGGVARATNGLPPIHCEWRQEVLTGAEYLDEREQVTIRIRGDRFGEITNYLANTFGAPSQPSKRYTNDLLHGWYARTDIGIGLQFYRDRTETGLVVVGPVKR